VASPGPRARLHLWTAIPSPAGEPAELPDGAVSVAFDGCPCGAQRTTIELPRSVTYLYRPKPAGRWQERATGCGRLPSMLVKKSRARATAGGAG
jgi:hypothetical protein